MKLDKNCKPCNGTGIFTEAAIKRSCNSCYGTGFNEDDETPSDIYCIAERAIIQSESGPRHNHAAFADWRDVEAQNLAEKIRQTIETFLENL